MEPSTREVAAPEGNARLTAMTGAVLFILLAIEGVTILRVQSLIVLHIFVGMVLLPVAVVKTATTMYRFTRYYTGDRAYVAKGAPPLLLRVVGPFVVALTAAVLGTGIAAGIDGPGTWWLGAHKASFILWFGVMTVHVLGHIFETLRLAAADFSRRAPVAGARTRTAILLLSLVVGVALALATRHWANAWRNGFAQ